MRDRLRQFAAAIFGLALVTSMALGAVQFTDPGVNSMDGAADEVVQRSEGQVALGGALLVGAATVWAYDQFSSDVNTTALKQQDALETKKEIYDQASIQNQNAEITSTSLGNYLNDTQTIALMEGKNAYIRALENGSTEPVARNQAIEAVANYYATKQRNILATWNTSYIFAKSAYATADNTTGVNAKDFVTAHTNPGPIKRVRYNRTSTKATLRTATLVNSETVHIPTPYGVYVDSDNYYTKGNFNFLNRNFTSASRPTIEVEYLKVAPPNDNFSPLNFTNLEALNQRWQEVEEQNQQVQDQLDVFINNTYDSYTAGEINTSDLVDPYLGAREYGPENASQFQSWSLRSLSAMGLDSPENLSNIGRMTVEMDGLEATGILMSDGQPEGGFTIGETYDPANLKGAQFVALQDGGTRELTQPFTLKSAETADGKTIQKNETITYRNVTYETANTTEFKQLQSELDALTARINARQQKLRGGSGGGGLFGGLGFGGMGLGSALPVVLVAAGAAVVLLGRN